MNKRKTTIFILLTAFSAALVICGTVFAYMFKKTDVENNIFTAAEVSCEIKEAFDGEKKESIKALNTGNIDAYIRVKLVSYWVDSKGDTVAKPSAVPTVTVAEGWIEGTDNTYYCKTAVAPTESTPELLSAPLVLQTDENGYLQVVEAFAEAIQSKPQNAVTESWSVTVAPDGSIATAP